MQTSPLYHHATMDTFECMGCHEMIEVPRVARLGNGHERRAVRIAGQPENLLIWLEMHELDHAQCHLYEDADKARQAREYRKEAARRKLTGESRDRCGSASATRGAGTGASAPLSAGLLRG